MDHNINFNINLNITLNGFSVFKTSTAQSSAQVEKPAPKSIKPVSSLRAERYGKKKSDTASLALLQKKINELVLTTNGLSRHALLVRAANALNMPIGINTIIGKISWPESYNYRANPHKLTEQELKDIAALLAGGATINTIAVALECGNGDATRSVCVGELMKHITSADVEHVKSKYKDILTLYGEYDRMVYDKRNVSGRKFHKRVPKDKADARKYHIKQYTPDQVASFVEAYESLPVSKTASIRKDLRKVMKLCNVCTTYDTMRRLLFAHAHIKGFEHIPTPDVKNIQIRGNADNTNLIQEIKYLRDVKHWTKRKISSVLGVSYTYVVHVYDAIRRPDVKLTPEMRAVCDERYKNMK